MTHVGIPQGRFAVPRPYVLLAGAGRSFNCRAILVYNRAGRESHLLIMTRRQLWILISLGIAIGAILILSASLSQVEFSPGEPFAFGTGMPMRPPPAGLSPDLPPAAKLLLRVLLLLMLALIPFSIYYLIISPAARKRLLQNLIVFGVFMAFIYLLRQQMKPGERTEDIFANLGRMAEGEAGTPRPPAEFSGAAPPWLVFLVSFILAAIIVALAIGVIWAILRRRHQPAPGMALEELAQKADEAREAIAAGGDLRNTVIRCYMEMNRVVRDSRGLQRERAMTPREFEERLEHSGLPGDQVRDLTRLFEEVRYGAKELGPWEGRRAVACLTAIAEACRNLVQDAVARSQQPPADAVRP